MGCVGGVSAEELRRAPPVREGEGRRVQVQLRDKGGKPVRGADKCTSLLILSLRRLPGQSPSRTRMAQRER